GGVLLKFFYDLKLKNPDPHRKPQATAYLPIGRSLIALLVLLGSLHGSALQARIIEDAPVIHLGHGDLSYLRDPTHQMNLDQARAAWIQQKFQHLDANLGLGFSSDVVWLHFRLENTAGMPSAAWLELMPPVIDDIQVFHLRPDGRWETRQGGDLFPQSSKEVSFRGAAFKLAMSPGTHEFFVRIQTTSTMVAIVKLWQPDVFDQYRHQSYFLYGVYFSLIIAVLIFCIFDWLVSRRGIFLLYSAYLGFNVLKWLGIYGFTGEFLLPEKPALANLAVGITLALDFAMVLIFFSVMLELRRYHPWVFWLYRFGILLAVATVIAALQGYYQEFAYWLHLTAIAVLACTPRIALRLWRSGNLASRMIAIAISAHAFLIGMTVLSVVNVLPYNNLFQHAGLAANLSHIMILHLGLLVGYRRSASYDELTGSLNRRSLDTSLVEEVERSQRYDRPLSVLMLDIDRFKRVNDEHGHLVGDKILIALCNLCHAHIRSSDIFGRWGGEEFLVICPETNLEQAQAVAEKVRNSVEEASFSMPQQLTTSIGVASCTKTDNVESLIGRADEALYRAKEGGRNRVSV
ncbi:MAG: sensor domain-containing diguanylate cyclase, partial [Proteobacteria bacterium]|nr:sensor domain-containing diguanylate cyclase [Pseudomonadota bacterium]